MGNYRPPRDRIPEWNFRNMPQYKKLPVIRDLEAYNRLNPPTPNPELTEMQDSINTQDNTKKRRGKKLMIANPTQGLGISGGLL